MGINSNDLEFAKSKINSIFAKYENKLIIQIYNSLFNDANKYSDSSIFEKITPTLQKCFESIEIDWSIKLPAIKLALVNSNGFKNMKSKLNLDYEYYLNNRIDLKIEGHFPDWVKYVIDESIKNKKPLLKQYARMLVGNYYFKKYQNSASKSAIYKNLIAMISQEEFTTWVSEDENCFKNILLKTINKFKMMRIEDFDKNVVLEQLMKSVLFKNAIEKYPFIEENLKKSEFSHLYESIYMTTNSNINVVTTIEEKKNDNSSSNTNSKSITTALKKEVKQIPGLKNQEKPNNELIKANEKKDAGIDGIDLFFKKIGKKTKKENNKFIDFLMDIENEINSVDNSL